MLVVPEAMVDIMLVEVAEVQDHQEQQEIVMVTEETEPVLQY